jgi:hypothetical protein
MPGPSYPNGAAAYQHAGIIPRLGAHTPFANSIARASRRIQGRTLLSSPAVGIGGTCPQALSHPAGGKSTCGHATAFRSRCDA